jgi:thiol-disulfide isomerase/thioredoxin
LTRLAEQEALLLCLFATIVPYVIHVMEGITALAKDYQNNGIGFVAISSNDVVNYPDDDPALNERNSQKIRLQLSVSIR